ncbi:DNA-binding transcriptional regulator Fis [Parahaliea mediterranea]|uniref:Putative Fis-like DNA-binding protein n=1 Tax=Parahaliea mediterranea TaxID=651086 RepID=A0A939IPI6_9GAMM|nr:DNA-binding transcriptional regulator Fis [Parahaliea mediterranea]
MSRADPLSPIAAPDSDGANTAGDEDASSHLSQAVTRAVRNYLAELDGQMTTDFYQMVLAEVEAPLLREIMAHTRNNQTKASIMLGLNRGTLRKKLKQYDLISDKS